MTGETIYCEFRRILQCGRAPLDFFRGLRAHLEYNTDMPPDILQANIEILARMLHPEQGSLKRIRLSDDSTKNANDLYGPGGNLIDSTPSIYLPSLNMIDQNEIFLYSYLLPQAKNLIYEGKLTLNNRESTFDDKTILPSMDDDADLHATLLRARQSEILTNTEIYISNIVYSLSNVLLKHDILGKYNYYLHKSGWRSKFRAIRGMAVLLEQSAPGLGTSVMNWLIPKVNLKAKDETITFTELVSRYSAGNKQWSEFAWESTEIMDLIRLTTIPAVKGAQTSLLSHPPNLSSFKRLMRFISKAKNVILDTNFGVAANQGFCAGDINRVDILVQCLGNLLGQSVIKMEKLSNHFKNIARGMASTTIDDIVLLEKLLSFFDEFFNIWIEGNNHEYAETYYNPLLPGTATSADRENFILLHTDVTIPNLVNHWMNWLNGKIYEFSTVFGARSLYFSNGVNYLRIYDESKLPSGFSTYHWLQNNFNLFIQDSGFGTIRGTRTFIVPYTEGTNVIQLSINDFMSGREVKIAKTLICWRDSTHNVPVFSVNSPLRHLLVVKEVMYAGRNSEYSERNRDSLADFAKWMFNNEYRRAQLQGIIGIGRLTTVAGQNAAFAELKRIFDSSSALDPVLSTPITVNSRTYTFENYFRKRVSTYQKVICYDFVIWLKEGLGFGVEYHGKLSEVYNWKKEFDAKQLLYDRIPMLYVCKNDPARRKILELDDTNGVIGRHFPLLTDSEFETMTDAWFHAYSKGTYTNFRDFIINLHTIMDTAIGANIQRAFGYNNIGQPLQQIQLQDLHGNYHDLGVYVVVKYWEFYEHSADCGGKFRDQYLAWSNGYPNIPNPAYL